MDCNTNQTRWKRVSRHHCCPICGKPDWCLTTGPDGSPTAAICARIESDRMVGSEGAGWLHRLRDDHQWRDRPRQRRVKIGEAFDRYIDFDAMAFDFEEALGWHQLQLLAAELGVMPEALDRLTVGWSAQHRAYSFPMYGADCHARGIRLRGTDGRKWSVRGGREGLFVPTDVFFGGLVIITEGPTDAAALIGLGLSAIGRPSCTGGAQLIIDWLCKCHPDRVVIFADADAPGQRGARSLAARLVGYVPAGVRIVTPGAKDARAWVIGGATRGDVLSAIDEAPLMQLRYGVKGGAA